MKKLILSAAVLMLSVAAWAQTKADVFGDVTITWLGLDFSQMHFIGSAAQWNDAGEITNSQLRDKYFPSWNDLFINEKDRYKVADAVNRTEVEYAIEVTRKANNSLKGNFFTDDMNMYQTLDEKKVEGLVKKYDYMGKKGIGMLFFVEGMSKGKEASSMWVAFVDMGTKKLLLAKPIEGKSGGFGFRNYWAKTFLMGVKEVKNNWKSWKKD